MNMMNFGMVTFRGLPLLTIKQKTNMLVTEEEIYRFLATIHAVQPLFQPIVLYFQNEHLLVL